MKILAIDASTKSTGYAIFDDKKIERYGLCTASSNDMIKRIQKIVKELDELIKESEVQKIILEEVRPETGDAQKVNMNAHKALMYLQAAIAFLVHDKYKDIKVEFIYPTEWRSYCGIKTGRGVFRDVQKKQAIEYAKKVYGVEGVNDDIADAIGIGSGYLAHSASMECINWE